MYHSKIEFIEVGGCILSEESKAIDSSGTSETNYSYGSLFGKLRFLFTRKNKFFLIFILFLTLLFSAFETLAILSVMPFVTAASNPDYVLSNGYLSAIYQYFGFYSPPQFVIAFGILLAFFYFFRQFYIYIYHYLLSKYAYGKYHFFAFRLFHLICAFHMRILQ